MRFLSLLAVVVFGLTLAVPTFAQTREPLEQASCSDVCDCSNPQPIECLSIDCPPPYTCINYCHDLPGTFEANHVAEFDDLGLAPGSGSEILLSKQVQTEEGDETTPAWSEEGETEKQPSVAGSSAQP